MKLRILFTLMIVLRLVVPAFAQPATNGLVSYTMTAKADDKYLYYKVKQGDNLTQIAKNYNTTVQVLQMLNTGININNILIGQTLVIPAKSSAPVAVVTPTAANTTVSAVQAVNTVQVKTTPATIPTGSPVYHKVAGGETLYAICAKYGTTAANVQAWNNIPNINNILVGTNLIVGYSSVPGSANMIKPVDTSTPGNMQTVKVSTDQSATVNTTAVVVKNAPVKKDSAVIKPVLTDDFSAVNNDDATVSGDLVAMTEKGIANWTKSTSDDGNYYALHRTAPVGTVITVRNLNNGNTVQVKVIGTLPDVASNKNVIIKISGSAAQKLDILDDKVLVQLSYMGYRDGTDKK